VAERWLTYGDAIESAPEAVHPVVLAAISNAKQYGASDAFAALYRLRELTAQVHGALDSVACLATPTIGTLYTVDEVEADPFVLNTRMGYYTYFANPLRLSAISVPTGLREDGLPFGMSLAAPAFEEATLARIAGALEARSERRSQVVDRVAQAARLRSRVAAACIAGV
jgi:allophanate hydrolase